jgi:glycosyltransferase involved in cell wall biosynthesis
MSVTTLARAQSTSPLFKDVAFAYVRREDSPQQHEIQGLAGQDVSLHEWSSSTGCMRFLAFTQHLRRVLRAGRFDVVHFHSSRAGFLGRLVARLTGRTESAVYSPHFFAFAKTDLSFHKRATYLLLERAAALWGNKVVVVSESEGELARALLPELCVAVLSNAVDNVYLDGLSQEAKVAREGLRQAPGKRVFRIVHVGRIAEQKCPQLFHAAIVALDERFPSDADLQIDAVWLGDGKRSLLGDSTGRIEVSGWLPSAVLHKRLAAADLVLFTSRGEGMPMALLEAQGLGIPVVASNVAGVRDVVAHGVTGFLGTSLNELVAYVCQVLTDDGLRARMGHSSQLRSAQLFDVRDLAERSRAAYKLLQLTVEAAA